MLVVHPASTCDVCLESYTARPQNIPYSISCGHVFCLNCLKSLRQHICPLCRSPFEASELRRLHIDRTESQLISGRRTPSPHVKCEQLSEFPPDNALGLVDDIPRATRLQRKISDLVLRGSFTSGVRERGVRELIQEIHAFLTPEPQDMHTDLRAELLLLYRFTELQAKYQQLETNAFDLRTENNRNKQAVADWERRYQDLQRSRARDQESARVVEASLRERLRVEELEWQRKYDFVSEQCTKLRDELDKLQFSTSVHDFSRVPRRSTSATQLSYLAGEESSSHHNYDARKHMSSKAKEDVDVFSHFNPDLFYLSPVPPAIILSNSGAGPEGPDSDDDTVAQKSRRRAPESPSRTSSTSSNISRASESAAALKPLSTVDPIRATANRQRSDSYPTRSIEKTSIYRFESQYEVSSSAPSSYMYRAASPTRALFPTTPPPAEASAQVDVPREEPEPVTRLYSLLEKSTPAPDARFGGSSSYLNKMRASGLEQQNARPSMPRSTSYQQTRSSDFDNTDSAPASSTAFQNTLYSRRANAPIQVQTSLLSASQHQRRVASSPQTPTQNQSQPQASESISPIQRTPPRPVLPHMHSYFSLYSPPPAKPVSPKENRVGVRGTLPRRGSLSSASAAALAASSASATVPTSSLGLRRSHGQGLFGGQDSDA